MGMDKMEVLIFLKKINIFTIIVSQFKKLEIGFKSLIYNRLLNLNI